MENKITVNICGTDYTLMAEESPSYMQKVAALVDAKMGEIMAGGRILGRGPAGELFADLDLMARSSVTPPQVIDLAQRLARDVSPAFSHITEVSDIVRTVKELMGRA